MSTLWSFVTEHWLAVLLIVIGAAIAGAALLRRNWLWVWVPAGAGVALLGVGDLVFPPAKESYLAWWTLATAGLALFAIIFVLLLTGWWSRWAAFAVVGVALLALGGGALGYTQEFFSEAGPSLLGVKFNQPQWLLLLLVIPVFVFLGWQSLDIPEVLRGNIESPRPWVSMLLRCSLVLFLAVALSDPRVRFKADSLTVIFLYDRSASIPQDLVPDPLNPQAKKDVRSERIRNFINKSVERHAAANTRDRAGLIVFGRRPRMELPPSDTPRFNLQAIPSTVDANYTDIAAAIKLAMASFPDDGAKRIILISDGNENLGNAEEQARLASQVGVQIDVLPLAAGQRNEDEILVERVEVPPLVEQGSNVPIRVLVRSFNPNIVLAKLTLKQVTEGEVTPIGEVRVRLRLGLNSYSFKRPLTDQQRSYTYEAEVQPEAIVDEAGKPLYEGRLPNDRVQNNRASAHVVARGQRRILILEGEKDSHKYLADKLVAAGDKKFKVLRSAANILDNYKDRDKLAVFLSNFDCVILANVANEQLTEEQQEVFRSNTHDQGCGLIMIGGPDSYGAGGWQNTAIEKALPVDCDIKSLKVQGKGGLVMIMHACEMAEGNYWQKKIAKLAVERLGPMDEVGILDWDFSNKWVVPLQEVGPNRAGILNKIDKMSPSDMPDFGGPLQMAHDALADKKKDYATKHVIVISDGDPVLPGAALIQSLKANKITVSTVCVAGHGPPGAMKAMSTPTGGRHHEVNNPKDLPAIYIKETRLVSQSFKQEQPFTPRVVFKPPQLEGVFKGDTTTPLYGFVRTTPKPSPLVEVPLITPKFQDQQDFPLLAYWHYGLGKSVAFTSDAGDPRRWCRDWISPKEGDAGMYAKFWEQIIDWSLRPVESQKLNMTTEYRDGKVRIIVEARKFNEKTGKDEPDVTLRLKGGVTLPSGGGGGPGEGDEGGKTITFTQTNSGQYVAEVKAEEAGSYFVNAQAVRVVKKKVVGKDGVEREVEVEEPVDGVRAGVTVPYSPEFADMEANTGLLEMLRERTKGTKYEDNDAALKKIIDGDEAFRTGLERVKSLQPVWYWLLFMTGILLFFDVASRRLAFESKEVVGWATRTWARVRGLPITQTGEPEFMERLRTRKEAVAQQTKAGKRFEGEYTGPLPTGVDATAPIAPPSAAPRAPAGTGGPKLAPDAPGEEQGDLASRLLKAKKKAMEERGYGDEKDKKKPK